MFDEDDEDFIESLCFEASGYRMRTIPKYKGNDNMTTSTSPVSRKSRLETINQRKEILENARKELKEHFVCLDHVIDKIVDAITLWYIDPTLLERAPILCLWGATGTGKTDLVKKLMTLLHLNDQFCHISMNGLDDKVGNQKLSFQKTVFTETDFRMPNNVILLDEFQWFNSRTEEGKNNKQGLFNDIWDFFSEREVKKELIYSEIEDVFRQIDTYKEMGQIVSVYYNGDDFDSQKKKDKYATKKIGQIMNLGDISLVQKLYFPDMRLKKLSTLKLPEFIEMLDEKRNTQEIFKDVSCKQYLIIISGNLDEAYSFCSDVSSYDIDADYYHVLSKRINIGDIKDSLQHIFREEHIGRLGNNHVIFPTIDKNGYEKIIKRYSSIFIDKIKEKHFVDVTLSDNVNKLLYNNSVYPTQGARPVFTTINDFFNAAVSHYLLEAVLGKQKLLSIDYDYKTNKVIGYHGKKKYEKDVTYIGDIDKIRIQENKKVNEKTIHAVHEAGHCIVYAFLSSCVPNKVVVSTNSSYGGFMFESSSKFTYKQYEDDITVYYGGIEAEEVVFGHANLSLGATADIRSATKSVAFLLRHTGIFNNTHVTCEGDEDSHVLNTDIIETNKAVEKLAGEYRRKARVLIEANKTVLIDLVDQLNTNNVMDSDQLRKFFVDHGFDFRIKPYEHSFDCENFVEMFHKFKKDNK